MKVLLICSVLLMSAIVTKAQEHTSSPTRPTVPEKASPWVTLHSEEGRFSVLMPELVKDQSETKASAKGPYTTHLFRAKTTRGMFIVGWVDYDPNFNFVVTSELQANRDNFVKGAKATLLSTTKITINGHPGLEFTAETPETIYRCRVYVIGRRSYQLTAATYKGQDDTYNVTRFFDSFQTSVRWVRQ